jgi:UDP:flavonoid glycosyltransferase YjiC (YdhE family)
LRPLVALATRLRDDGHTLSLVFTVVDGTDHAARSGLAVRTVPASMTFSLEEIVAHAGDDASPTKILEAVVAQTFRPHVDAMYEAALDLCDASDVVIGASSSWPLKAAALVKNVPYVVVDFFPMVPSRVVPPTGLADWGWFNGARWMVVRKMLDMAFVREPAAFFAKKGLPVPRHAVPDVVHSDVLNLHAASETLCPRAPDWPASHVVCGELHLEEPWSAPRELAEFIASGEPPVLMSLGSMEHLAPTRARDLLVAAAREARVRAIVQTKRAQSEGRDGDLYFASWLPHRHVLGSCRAIVHHGGAGTTHAAARAGCPSVVLPFIVEQRLWGQRLARLGAARVRSFWKATPERVARDIHEALALAEPAKRIASSMSGEERGVDVAVRALERLMKGAS